MVEVCEDSTDVHTMRFDCLLVNPLLGLRSVYATVRVMEPNFAELGTVFKLGFGG